MRLALNLGLARDFPGLGWCIEIPKRYQGPQLEAHRRRFGKPTDWRTETFHEHFAVRNRIPAFEGLRNERFKYVRYFDHGNHEFLHDLVKNDPDELVNLAERLPEYSDMLKAMRERTTKASCRVRRTARSTCQ